MLKRLGCGAALAAALLLNGCGSLRLDIQGKAMSPTLEDGESVLGTRSFDEIRRGDIVAHRYPKDESKSFVKRVIGLPGEQIESIEGAVLIDGKALEELYVIEQNRTRDSWGPIRLGEGEYFVMGDNRRNSSDSRTWGTVRRAAIWAKVLGR